MMMVVPVMWIIVFLLQSLEAQVTITTQPSNVTVCIGGEAEFTCVLTGPSITTEDITTAGWQRKGSNYFLPVSGRKRHITIPTTIDDTLNDTLIVSNVSRDGDGALYRCMVTDRLTSNIVAITVTGDIPDAITDLYAPPHLITSSSFVVHWSEPSSDVVCGPVQYIITVSTGGIITWNITINRTTYTATGLCSNTSYKVNVFADNIAGNSIPTTIRIMTIPSVSHFIAPSIVKVQLLNSTSFTVNWTPSDPNYNYAVIWTNLHTGVMYNSTISRNTNSYTVTGLSGDVNYNVSVAAMNMCGKIVSSDPITVYDAPNEPQFVYCVSYREEPALQIFSQVTVDLPRMSLMLTFSASHQFAIPTVTNATCSDIQNNVQYYCTAEFSVDINPSVEIIQSVNVTVSGPYGSSSSVMEVKQKLGPLLDVAQGEVLENSAELNCTLACFSPNIHCKLFNIAINGVKCELTPNYTTSSISGLFNSYDYPTQRIMIYDLTSGTRYNYCVTGVSVSDEDTVEVGEPFCGSFTTSATRNENDGSSSSLTVIVATISCSLTFILTLTITAITTFGVTYMCMRQKPDGSSNQLPSTQKVFYEKIDTPHIINPRNPQNPVYDTTQHSSRSQGTQDLNNLSGRNGYELMASVRVQQDLDNIIPPLCEKPQETSTVSDRYVQTKKHPALYHNITPGQPSTEGEENLTYSINQRSNKEYKDTVCA